MCKTTIRTPTAVARGRATGDPPVAVHLLRSSGDMVRTLNAVAFRKTRLSGVSSVSGRLRPVSTEYMYMYAVSAVRVRGRPSPPE